MRHRQIRNCSLGVLVLAAFSLGVPGRADNLNTCLTFAKNGKESKLTLEESNKRHPSTLYAKSTSGGEVLVAVFDSNRQLVAEAPPQWLDKDLDFFELDGLSGHSDFKVLVTCVAKSDPQYKALSQMVQVCNNSRESSQSRPLYLKMTSFTTAQALQSFGSPQQSSSVARPGPSSSNPSANEYSGGGKRADGGGSGKKAPRRRNSFKWSEVADHHAFGDGKPYTLVLEFRHRK